MEAFWPRHHSGLIRQAFERVPEARNLVDVDSAVEKSEAVDNQENDEGNQHKHSMRPANQTLAAAQEHADNYRQSFMELAVKFAVRGDKKVAGEALGRLLHVVQDRKHNWCSCGAASNRPDSANNCSQSGCATPGLGNHALGGCRKSSLEVSLPWDNFQLWTDGSPTQPQLDRAVGDSVGVLTEFAIQVQRSRKGGTP